MSISYTIKSMSAPSGEPFLEFIINEKSKYFKIEAWASISYHGDANGLEFNGDSDREKFLNLEAVVPMVLSDKSLNLEPVILDDKGYFRVTYKFVKIVPNKPLK